VFGMRLVSVKDQVVSLESGMSMAQMPRLGGCGPAHTQHTHEMGHGGATLTHIPLPYPSNPPHGWGFMEGVGNGTLTCTLTCYLCRFRNPSIALSISKHTLASMYLPVAPL
jgi:hypothetical protein